MKNNQGFSLLEVLISLAVMAVGLLGFAQAELKTIRQMYNYRVYTILQQNAASLSETVQESNNPHVAIKDFESQLKTTFPFVNIHHQMLSSHLLQIQFNWQKYNENYQLQQTIYLPERI